MFYWFTCTADCYWSLSGAFSPVKMKLLKDQHTAQSRSTSSAEELWLVSLLMPPHTVWPDPSCRHHPRLSTISWLVRCIITGPEDPSRTEGCIRFSVLTCCWMKLTPGCHSMRLNHFWMHPRNIQIFSFFKYGTRLAAGLGCISPAVKRSSCVSSDFQTWKACENFFQTYMIPQQWIFSWTTDIWASHLLCALAARWIFVNPMHSLMFDLQDGM